MARLKTIVCFGQSNMEGNGQFTDLTEADLTRLFGVTAATDLTDAGTDLTIPGIQYFTTRFPYNTDASGRNLTNPIWTDPPTTLGAGFTASTTTTLTDSAASWTTNEWAGKWMQVFSTNVVEARKIVSNTSTTLTVSPAFSAAPQVGGPLGSSYIIYDSGTQSIATYEGAWQQLRFFYQPVLNYIPANGYEHPNFKSLPKTYGSFSFVFGPDLELGWQMREGIGEEIGIIKLAVGSAYMTTYRGTLPNAAWSWYDPSVHNDWSPASTYGDPGSKTYDLFGVLTEVMFPAAKADAIEAGYEGLDVIAVFQKQGESDATILDRANACYDVQLKIRDLMRAALRTHDMCAGDPAKVFWIMGGHDETPGIWTYASTVNAGFQQIAKDDPYAAYVETTGIPYNSGDSAHLAGQGQLTLGKSFYEAFKALQKRASSATTPRNRRRTLGQLRALVKRRYERNGVSNNSEDTQVDMFLNDSMRELFIAAGDDCWYLRRVEQMSLTGGVNNLNDLPASVHRIVRIEPVGYPRTSLAFEKVADVDEGRTQITLQESLGGSYYVHFQIAAPDMVGDDDVCLLPDQYVETLVALTCKRLAESSGNGMQAAYYASEAERLMRVYLRDVKRQSRARKDNLKVRDHNTWFDHHYEDATWRFW